MKLKLWVMIALSSLMCVSCSSQDDPNEFQNDGSSASTRSVDTELQTYYTWYNRFKTEFNTIEFNKNESARRFQPYANCIKSVDYILYSDPVELENICNQEDYKKLTMICEDLLDSAPENIFTCLTEAEYNGLLNFVSDYIEKGGHNPMYIQSATNNFSGAANELVNISAALIDAYAGEVQLQQLARQLSTHAELSCEDVYNMQVSLLIVEVSWSSFLGIVFPPALAATALTSAYAIAQMVNITAQYNECVKARQNQGHGIEDYVYW